MKKFELPKGRQARKAHRSRLRRREGIWMDKMRLYTASNYSRMFK